MNPPPYCCAEMPAAPRLNAYPPPALINRIVTASPFRSSRKIGDDSKHLFPSDSFLQLVLGVSAKDKGPVFTFFHNTVQDIRSVIPSVKHHVAPFGILYGFQPDLAHSVQQGRPHRVSRHCHIHSSAQRNCIRNIRDQIQYGYFFFSTRHYPPKSITSPGPISSVGCAAAHSACAATIQEANASGLSKLCIKASCS